MEELIRAKLHDALAVDEPHGLRARVIAGVPMERKRVRRPVRLPLNLQWAAGLAAILVTAALLIGLLGTRLLVRPEPVGPVGPQIHLTNPYGIAIAPDGTLYVSDFTDGRIFRIRGNTLVSVAGGGAQAEGPGSKANIFGPLQMAFSPDGDLYIGEGGGTRISRLDKHGNLSTVASTLGTVQGLAFGPGGSLFASIVDQVTTVIPAGRAPIDFSSIGGPAVFPGFLTFGADENLYIADQSPVKAPVQLTPPAMGGCRVLKSLLDNTVSLIAGTGHCGFSGDGGPATRAELDDPSGLAFDSAGNLYVGDSNNHRIRRIDTHGVITTIAGTGVDAHSGDGGQATSAQLEGLSGLAIAQGRYLYFVEVRSDQTHGAVRVIDLRTGVIRTVVDSSSRVIT